MSLYAALAVHESALVASKFLKMANGYQLSDRRGPDTAAELVFRGRTVYVERSEVEPVELPRCPLVERHGPFGDPAIPPYEILRESPAFNLYFCAELAALHCQAYEQRLRGVTRPQLFKSRSPKGDSIIRRLSGFDGRRAPSKVEVLRSRSKTLAPGGPESYWYLVDFGTFTAEVFGAVMPAARLGKMFEDLTRAGGPAGCLP